MSNKTDAKTQNNKVMTKREIELENGILCAFLALDRAKRLHGDTVDEFFNGYNENDESKHQAIIYEFERYRAYAECVDMLICDAYNELQKFGASRW